MFFLLSDYDFIKICSNQLIFLLQLPHRCLGGLVKVNVLFHTMPLPARNLAFYPYIAYRPNQCNSRGCLENQPPAVQIPSQLDRTFLTYYKNQQLPDAYYETSIHLPLEIIDKIHGNKLFSFQNKHHLFDLLEDRKSTRLNSSHVAIS